MPRKKKQPTQQSTEAPNQEDQSESIIVSSVEGSTSQAPVRLTVDGQDAGYIVQCGMCNTDIWTSYVDDDLVFICGPCAETLPE